MCICGHADIWHDHNDDAGLGRCRFELPCGCAKGRLGEPQLVGTFDSAGHAVEAVVKPGTSWPGFGHPPVKLCGCEDCKALYAEVAA
jgi:hypothetical protein